jgi:hypothetical protein
MAVLRQMTGDFRDPVIRVLLAIVTDVTEIVAFVLLDQDLIKHRPGRSRRPSTSCP